MPGVDLDPGAPSLFRFGAQNRNEPAPTRVAYASREPGFGPRIVGQILAGVVRISHGFGSSQHVGNLEVFNHKQVIAPDENTGLLVVEVFALVRDFPMPCRVDVLPVAGGSESANANIDAGLATGGW